MKHHEVRNRAACGILPLVVSVAMWVAATGACRAAQQRDADSQRVISAAVSRTTLPSGTVIPVRLDSPLSSKTAMSGDRFTATVIRGSDDAGLPEGTRLEGTVREAAPSDGEQPGSLDVDFRRIVFPDGNGQDITGSLYSLSGKAVKRADGRLVATVDKGKDRLKFIGIGAGAGLIIGTLTKQNTILSLLLGAGAGYLYNELGNKPKPGDVNLKQGQEFGVRLDRALNFNAQTRRYYRVVSGAQAAKPAERVAAVSGDQIRVVVDGQPVTFSKSTQPFIRSGTVFVPLAAVGKAAKFDFRYDAANRILYARQDQVSAALGSKNALVNGERFSMPAAAVLRNGVTFVPLQLIAWAADATVGWDETSGTVNVTTAAQP